MRDFDTVDPDHGYCAGMTHALALLKGRRPTDADRPPVSTLPHTRASRAAMRLTREWRRVSA